MHLITWLRSPNATKSVASTLGQSPLVLVVAYFSSSMKLTPDLEQEPYILIHTAGTGQHGLLE